MADGVLFNTIEKLIGKLGSMAVEAWNVRDDVEKLVESMSEIKAVISDAEEQEQQQGGDSTNSAQLQLWLQKLKDALYDAEDLLDDFSTEHLRRHVMTKHNKTAKKVHIFFSPSNQIVFSFKMAQKIKDLRKRIEGLNVDRRVFHFTNSTPARRRVLKQKETHSFIREEEVIGREKEKKELIELLLNTNLVVNENVSVLSIIGIGGLGKTALAQLVYNDKAVQQHFELKKWVCVADDSDVRGFDVKSIAAKITESGIDDEMDQLQQKLRKKVEGRRYLFVLDDVWNEKREHWLQLKTLLVDGAKGSKIIITTRSEEVAKISGTSSPLFLKGLDEKQSWKMFSQLAFEDGKESENQNLVSIGKEIVEKCVGVPLAIRSIGSLMYSMETEKDWSSFKNKDLMKIDEQGDNTIFQLIKLSYDHLPSHLKKCFAFCSLFPKDYHIKSSMLIRLWIAQGFVQSSDDESLEDIGHKYIMTLVHRSFFQDFEKYMTVGDFRFKMHDLVHDLAQFISGKDYVLVNEKGQQHIEKGTRHVSFGFALDSSWQVPNSLLEAYKLRTFLLPHRASLDESAYNSMMSSYKQIRVLDLHYMNSRKISSCIGMLKHLRYLDLSNSKDIEVLPRSITKLITLETLLLNLCFKLSELPKDLWKLTSLRHLEFMYCPRLTCMPRGIGELTNLQTLTRFELDTTSLHSAGAIELGQLNDLRGRLEISGLECLRRSPTDAKEMNLMGKSHLQWLKLAWGCSIDADDHNVDIEKDDMILQGLLPHPNMKALEIRGFGSVTFSNCVNSFTNLNELSVVSCNRLQYLPQLHVKSLHLCDLPCLEWIVKDDSSNGSSSTFSQLLTKISLDLLPNLKGWCRCSEEKMQMQRGCYHFQFKSLDRLFIRKCPNLISIPQHMNIKRVELYKVREKLLQQAVNHSKVEILDIVEMGDLKSLSRVLQHLSTLREFFIGDCEELDPCNDEDGCYSMQWKELKNVKQLSFCNIPKMEYLPEGLQHVTTLESLRIENCANLTSIPEWVKSLQSLKITECPKLTSLPEGVEVKNY